MLWAKAIWYDQAMPLNMEKTVLLTEHPVLMAKLSSPEKRDWMCWEHDSKDQSLHHIHPVKASNVRKIIMEFPAKPNLSELGIFFFCSLNQWNSASRWLVFFKVVSVVFVKWQISSGSKCFLNKTAELSGRVLPFGQEAKASTTFYSLCFPGNLVVSSPR